VDRQVVRWVGGQAGHGVVVVIGHGVVVVIGHGVVVIGHGVVPAPAYLVFLEEVLKHGGKAVAPQTCNFLDNDRCAAERWASAALWVGGWYSG